MFYIGKIIKELRNSHNISQAELAEQLGISYSMMGMIEQGRRNVSDEVKIKICKIFNVSMDYLMGMTNIEHPKQKIENELSKLNLSSEEYDKVMNFWTSENTPPIIDTFEPQNKIDEANNIINSILTSYLITNTCEIKNNVLSFEEGMELKKKNIDTDLAFIKMLKSLKKENIVKSCPSKSALVFVYGTIPAGIPMECIEDIIDTEEISADMLRGNKQYFGLKVKGNSMNPDYLDGDILILEKVDDCESGDDAIVMVNGNDGTFKRVFKNKEQKTITLQPLNMSLDENGKPLYEPKTFTEEQIENLPVRIIGVVEEIRRKKKKILR